MVFLFVLPSYASLSSSDGSTFVTKAEFDSAIAEITSELVVFEAGLNSKIDSQVTSYLDRNGIWSGKAQKVPTAKVDWTRRSATDLTSFYRFTTTADASETKEYYLGGFLLTKANKSGLMMLVYKDYVESTQTERMAFGYHCGGFAKGDYQSDCNVTATVDVAELSGDWDESEVGQCFYRKQDAEKAVFVPDNALATKRSLNDNISQVIASQSVWTSMSNTRTYDGSIGINRYWMSAYVNGTQYTLFGFVKKGKFYSLSWKQTMWCKVPFSKQIDCIIAAVEGVDMHATKADYATCRPQCDIVLCDIY